MEKYFKFEGSATRSEYWAVVLIGGVVGFTFALLGALLLAAEIGAFASVVGGLILAVTLIGALWLSIATTMRRCRNAGINTWWTLGTFVPYVGWIVSIVIGCLKTDEPAA